MIFCEKCFSNPEISAIINHVEYQDGINNKSTRGRCPICENTDVILYDTALRAELKDFFEPLLDLYELDENLPASFPTTELKYLYEDLDETWKLFNPKISKKNIALIIKNLCSDYEKNKNRIFDKKVGIIDKYNLDKVKEYALVANNDWDIFVDELKTKNRYNNKYINDTILRKYCSYLEKRYRKGHIFYRGRISKTGEGHIAAEMGAPPINLAKPGRANSEGISHLYLANDEKTTIHEVRAGAFDIISVGTFELQRDITVIDFQKLDAVYPFIEGIALIEYAINIDHLRKLNKEISKALRRDDSPLDYLPTQFISDYIKSFSDSNGQPVYRGIEYQSTINRDGYNIVAFYPSDFRCINVKVVTVKNIEYIYGDKLY